MLSVTYLLLREADPLKTKPDLILEPSVFLFTIFFCGRCLSTLAMDLLENGLVVRPEKINTLTLLVSKLSKYMACLVSVSGLTLKIPSCSC